MNYSQIKMGSKKEKNSFLEKNYMDCWKYLKINKLFIFYSSLIFLLFIILGDIFFYLFEEQINVFIREIILKTQNYNVIQMIFFILNNNLWSSFIAIIFGIVLGIVPIISLISNGYLLGYVIHKTLIQEGVLYLWRLFPHGIFEIPAVIISFSLGIRLGFFIFNKNPKKDFYNTLLMNLRIFLFVILPFLIIAAIIEGSLIGFLK